MVFRGENMLITNNMLKNFLKDYSNINNKICREVKDKKLYRIVNGLYDTNGDTSAYLLASSIYGPSYISFEYALSYYGLIPERVNAVTCATFNKKKRKIYNNHFGTFSYEDVPSRAFPYEIILKQEGLKAENIIDCGICSVCNSNQIHSFRVEKEGYGLGTAIIELK